MADVDSRSVFSLLNLEVEKFKKENKLSEKEKELSDRLNESNREISKYKVKEFISLFSSLKYPDKLFIYDDKELVWQGYINEKQMYKYLEDKEVIEMYLGDDGLIAKVV